MIYYKILVEIEFEKANPSRGGGAKLWVCVKVCADCQIARLPTDTSAVFFFNDEEVLIRDILISG